MTSDLRAHVLFAFGVKAYNPDQPRDALGRFGEGGVDRQALGERYFDFDHASLVKHISRGDDPRTFTGSGGERPSAADVEQARADAAYLQEHAAQTNSGQKLLYRGAAMRQSDLDKLKAGQTYQIDSLSAATPDQGIAKIYADPQYAGDGADVSRVIMRVENPKGITGLPLNDGAEVVLPKGDSYRITRLVREGGVTYVDLYQSGNRAKPRSKDWDESAHPRDEAGRFAGGGSGPYGHNLDRPTRILTGTPSSIQADLERMFPGAEGSLNYRQKEAVGFYKGEGYKSLNGYLRDGEVPEIDVSDINADDLDFEFEGGHDQDGNAPMDGAITQDEYDSMDEDEQAAFIEQIGGEDNLPEYVYDENDYVYDANGNDEETAFQNEMEAYVEALNEERGGSAGEMDDYAKYIDQAIAGSTLSENLTVFRSVGNDAIPFRNMLGGAVDDAGFISTSASEKFARNWGGRTIMVIHLEKGDHALPMFAQSGGLDGENELLLPRGSWFDVIADSYPDTDGTGRRIIEMTVGTHAED